MGVRLRAALLAAVLACLLPLTGFARDNPRASGRGSSAPLVFSPRLPVVSLSSSIERQDTADASAGYVASTAEMAWQASPARGVRQQEPAEETLNNQERSVGIPAIDGAEDVNPAAGAAGRGSARGQRVAARTALPPVRHVFLILLENESFTVTFGKDSPAPYLARTLPREGALLTRYYAIGHASLDNYVALISGQAPNLQTQLDCGTFSDFHLAQPELDAGGQALGEGCVYPTMVKTLPDQLEAAGLTWRAYMEDMGNDPSRESATCGHVPLGAQDPTSVATPSDKYAAKHDPFVYFHSIIDDAARCNAHVVNLRRLPQDLRSLARTPHYTFITPNLCNDGHDPQCVDGSAGGLPAVNTFLRRWVPLITASPAFRKDGLLIITFDESDGAGSDGSSACCGEQPLPGARYAPGFRGPGGGRIGAVLLSPFIRPGTVSAVPYNHYSLLRSVEDLFHLRHLGYAAAPSLRSFGKDVFTGSW